MHQPPDGIFVKIHPPLKPADLCETASCQHPFHDGWCKKKRCPRFLTSLHFPRVNRAWIPAALGAERHNHPYPVVDRKDVRAGF